MRARAGVRFRSRIRSRPFRSARNQSRRLPAGRGVSTLASDDAAKRPGAVADRRDRRRKRNRQRSFPDGRNIPMTANGEQACLNVVGVNSKDNVTWVHSYVTGDKKKTFCIYDAPNPDAIRRVATNNGLPVDKITEVKVLDPYFYR